MKWLPIDRDENGFATEECLEKIFNNLPCVVCSQTEGGYKYYNMVGEYFDMMHNREDLRTNTGYTHVKFSYGYTKRTMTFEIESITIGKGNPEWGAPTEEVFIIKLGKRV